MKYFNYEEFDSPDEIGSGLPTTDGESYKRRTL